MKNIVSKYSRPIEFRPATEQKDVKKETDGNEVALMYKSIVNGKNSKQSIKKKHWCETCNLSTVDYNQHIQGTAHIIASQAEAETPVQLLELGATNVGFHMLRSQGWKYEQGLGKYGQGKRTPVATALKRNRLCLGQQEQEKKRVSHSHEEIERKRRLVKTQDPGKEIARSTERESKERVALLYYLKD